jgi:hypothetical protein
MHLVLILIVQKCLQRGGWESQIPSLPFTFATGCMVIVNSTTLMIIGGKQNDKLSGKTFYFNFGGQSWNDGPELKYKREGHSCGRIRRDKDSQEISVIVVAGGDGFSDYFSSVEILNESSNTWTTGPELPFGITFFQMVEDSNRGVVLIGGESATNSSLDTLYQLPHGGPNAVWTKMKQKLTTKRDRHIAFLVPNSIVDCSYM